ELIRAHATPVTGRALDVGCQSGVLTDAVGDLTPYAWTGVDPALESEVATDAGTLLRPGSARDLPGDDGAYDCVLLANVYEHIAPKERRDSFAEMRRVLRPGGVVVGQLPNPYFPIESHSRLPFMGWLPRRLQFAYWKLTPVAWDHDFYVVTIRDVRRTAEDVGLTVLVSRPFNYPPEVIPRSVRWAARALEQPMRW